MKKIFLLAVVIAIIGISCAFVFNKREPKTVTNPDEKPWTVGEATETDETQTEPTVFDDAVMCFSDFINTELREKYSFFAESSVYRTLDFSSAILGLYVYDVDGDETEELSVVSTNDGNICLEVYEFIDGKAELSATTELVLDPMDLKLFTKAVTGDANVAARMTIFPNGKERAYCLTCELAEGDIGYNAYTVVFDYADGEISLKNSYRLRTKDNKLTLISTADATPLYTATGAPVEVVTDTSDIADVTDVTEETEAQTEIDVTVESDFDSLTDAFNDAFGNIGLKAPDVSANGSALSKYKVTPIENEQKIFEFAGGNGEVMFSENGFLHSFIIDI